MFQLAKVLFLASLLPLHESVRINCDYKYIPWPIIGNTYTCQVKNLNVTESNDSVLKVLGNHYNPLGNHHVRGFDIRAQTCYFFPLRIRNWFPNVEAIQIHNSRLKVITHADLQPFIRLRVLHLSANQLTTLDNKLFEHNPNLVRIDFKHQKIKHIGYNILDFLDQLAMANFDESGCVNFYAQNGRQGVQDLKKEIRVNCQPIAEMIAEVESLKEMVASLKSINEKTQEMIKHMNYDDDPRISKLNSMYTKMQNDNKKCLENLGSVTKNFFTAVEKFDAVEKSLKLNESQGCVLQNFEKEKLERIKRDATSIEIDCELVEWKERLSESSQLSCNIKHLKVTENDMEIKRITSGHKMEEIDTSSFAELKAFNKRATFLPLKLGNMFKNLKVLSFVQCGLIEIGSEALIDLKSLTSLIVSTNAIKKINPKAFKDLGSLNLLDLSYNNLEDIHIDTFQFLPELSVLKLSFNKLFELKSNIFVKLSKLKNLFLQGNRLMIIDVNVLDPLRKLEFVDFTNNDCIDESSTKSTLRNLKATLADECSNSNQL